MSGFEGLANANVFERGAYLNPGAYKLRITKCLKKDTRKSGVGFIAEFEVVETSDAAKHPKGSKATWFQSLKDRDVAFGAIKEFTYAVLGYNWADPEQKERCRKEVDPLIEALINDAVSEKNGLAGKEVKVQTFIKKTAGKNLDFTVHQWSPAQ